MNRRQVIRSTALSVIPLLLLGTGVVLSSAGPAGAGGTKHKAKLAHVGPDVEGLSKVSFTCNTAAVGPTGGSGTWSVTLTNVQVIGSDGSTEWPTPLTVDVLFGSNTQLVEIHSSRSPRTRPRDCSVPPPLGPSTIRPTVRPARPPSSTAVTERVSGSPPP